MPNALTERDIDRAVTYTAPIQTRGRVQYLALLEVLEERDRQDEKWGLDNDLTFLLGMGIVAEEAGEFVKACMDHRYSVRQGNGAVGSRDEVRKELVQTAASALKVLERFDRWASRQNVRDSQ